MSRRFLYLSPYFPPQSRVGALRPLKFARHLPKHGWEPVVLADLWPSDALNAVLLNAVPEGTVVVRDYSKRALAAESAFAERVVVSRTDNPGRDRPRPLLERLLPSWLDNPEIIPLGEHSANLPHAYKAALRVLDQHPGCEAIVVNADPYATLVLGAKLAKATGLPLVQDLRDPWSVCELRRPMRPWLSRLLTDRLERSAFEPAKKIIINTETALDHYRAAYADIDPERFTCIRNHHDAELVRLGVEDLTTEQTDFGRFTLLFLGHFRRFVEGDVLIEVLARLKARGLERDVQLVVTGNYPHESQQMAHDRGVSAMIQQHPFVPYTATGPVMDSADVLVALNNRTVQRIPAKLYDYVTTRRPVLLLADSPELERLSAQLNVNQFGLDDADSVANWLEPLIRKGRHPDVERDAHFLSSAVASEKLASILNDVTRSSAR